MYITVLLSMLLFKFAVSASSIKMKINWIRKNQLSKVFFKSTFVYNYCIAECKYLFSKTLRSRHVLRVRNVCRFCYHGPSNKIDYSPNFLTHFMYRNSSEHFKKQEKKERAREWEGGGGEEKNEPRKTFTQAKQISND